VRLARILAVAAVALSATLAHPAATGGKPPGKKRPGTPGISISQPASIVFGSSGSIVGRLTGKNHAGRTVTLDADAYPYSTFHPRATTVSDQQGNYRFTVSPRVNTRYRVRAPSRQTATVVLKVRFRVTLAVGDLTPRRGSRVRFLGSVRPARDGRRVRIQKLSSRGTFFTLATARLRDAGTSRSRYSKRVRIRRSGVYRVKMFGDPANAIGYSRTVSVTVH
jgi:hypothetical protein